MNASLVLPRAKTQLRQSHRWRATKRRPVVVLFDSPSWSAAAIGGDQVVIASDQRSNIQLVHQWTFWMDWKWTIGTAIGSQFVKQGSNLKQKFGRNGSAMMLERMLFLLISSKWLSRSICILKFVQGQPSQDLPCSISALERQNCQDSSASHSKL